MLLVHDVLLLQHAPRQHQELRVLVPLLQFHLGVDWLIQHHQHVLEQAEVLHHELTLLRLVGEQLAHLRWLRLTHLDHLEFL